MALRHLLVVALAVFIVGAVGWAVVQGAIKARDTIREQDAQGAAESATPTFPTPVNCVPDDLVVEVATPDSVKAGSGMAVKATIKNVSKAACLLDAGGASVGTVITSGSQTIWTSTVCPSGPEHRELLMPAGGSTSVTITWDGYSQGTDCSPAPTQAPTTATPTPTDPAASAQPSEGAEPSASATPEAEAPQSSSDRLPATAGTYRVRVQLGGEDLTEEQVFVVE